MTLYANQFITGFDVWVQEQNFYYSSCRPGLGDGDTGDVWLVAFDGIAELWYKPLYQWIRLFDHVQTTSPTGIITYSTTDPGNSTNDWWLDLTGLNIRKYSVELNTWEPVTTVVVSPTPPGGASDGDLWVRIVNGKFILSVFDGGTSTFKRVKINPFAVQDKDTNSAFKNTVGDNNFIILCDDLALDFAAALSAGEETNLDTLITNHTPSADLVDAAQFPLSDLDGIKLAVHSSPKPSVSGLKTYAVWSGCGDDIAGTNVGDGPLLHFASEIGTGQKSIKVEFLSTAGRVWVHEGYLKFSDGGDGDYMSADIVAYATPLQQSTDLDYNVTNNWITWAGAGLGTHGLAGTPVLLPRTFSKDGDWDYDGTNLTPNGTQTGGYKMSDVEKIVHRYINRIPCYGTVTNYFTMSSEETTEIPTGYYMNITQYNVSDTVWHASVIMEIYREVTDDS